LIEERVQRIVGKVTDSHGKPLEGVEVFFIRGNTPGSGFTDNKGVYRLRKPSASLDPKSPYTFRFLKPGYETVVVNLDADNPLEVKLVGSEAGYLVFRHGLTDQLLLGVTAQPDNQLVKCVPSDELGVMKVRIGAGLKRTEMVMIKIMGGPGFRDTSIVVNTAQLLANVINIKLRPKDTGYFAVSQLLQNSANRLAESPGSEDAMNEYIELYDDLQHKKKNLQEKADWDQKGPGFRQIYEFMRSVKQGESFIENRESKIRQYNREWDRVEILESLEEKCAGLDRLAKIGEDIIELDLKIGHVFENYTALKSDGQFLKEVLSDELAMLEENRSQNSIYYDQRKPVIEKKIKALDKKIKAGS
jgi:hypothetical protein